MYFPGAGKLSACSQIALALILAKRFLNSTLNIGDISSSYANAISSLILYDLM